MWVAARRKLRCMISVKRDPDFEKKALNEAYGIILPYICARSCSAPHTAVCEQCQKRPTHTERKLGKRPTRSHFNMTAFSIYLCAKLQRAAYCGMWTVSKVTHTCISIVSKEIHTYQKRPTWPHTEMCQKRPTLWDKNLKKRHTVSYFPTAVWEVAVRRILRYLNSVKRDL